VTCQHCIPPFAKHRRRFPVDAFFQFAFASQPGKNLSQRNNGKGRASRNLGASQARSESGSIDSPSPSKNAATVIELKIPSTLRTRAATLKLRLQKRQPEFPGEQQV